MAGFELPYTAEVYFAAMAEYHVALFPAVVVAALLPVVALALALRPPTGREGLSARIVGALLAAVWVWVGAVHQLQVMAGLNFMAPVYGIAWIVQGALIVVTCTLLGRVRFRVAGDVRGWIGLALALIGLVAYPLAALALGADWRGLPLAGTAPDPTAVFTAGLLLTARERPPLHLFVLPLGWAGVAAVSAYLIDFPLDYVVPAAVLAAAALAIRARE